jgi:hypothetical protein
MKTFSWVEVYLHAFLTSALDGSEWSAWRPDRSSSGKIVPNTDWIGSWVGPRGNVDSVRKKNLFPCWESNPILQESNA